MNNLLIMIINILYPKKKKDYHHLILSHSDITTHAVSSSPSRLQDNTFKASTLPNMPLLLSIHFLLDIELPSRAVIRKPIPPPRGAQFAGNRPTYSNDGGSGWPSKFSVLKLICMCYFVFKKY